MPVKTYKERKAEILRDPERRDRIARETAAILAANRLARLREQAGLTQAEVARMLGVTQSSWSAPRTSTSPRWSATLPHSAASSTSVPGSATR